MTPDEAAQLLTALQLRLSHPLLPEVLQRLEGIMEVWLRTTVTTGPAIVPTRTELDAKISADPQTLVWQATAPRETLIGMFRGGGRIIIIAHCGHLIDDQKRPFSAALDALTGFDSPHLPGGELVSWFFVRRPG
jgi:hypothetical protein